jgi:hypothetical protein
MQEAIQGMTNRGIRLSGKVVAFALNETGESDES